MKRLGLALVCGVLMLGTSAAAQEAPPGTSPLLNLLRYVPDTPVTRQWLTYGNQAAWYHSWGIEPIEDMEDFMARNESEDVSVVAWMQIMPRQTFPIQTLGTTTMLRDDLRGFYGFDQFVAQQYLEAGQPPTTLSVVHLNVDEPDVDSALTASGYVSSALDTGMLYSLGEDDSMPPRGEGPQVGQFGGLNRVAMLDEDITVIGRSTGIIDAALSAEAEDESLADDPAYQSVAAVLEGEPMADFGEFVGAVMLDAAMFISPDPSVLFGGRATAAQIEVLMATQQAYYDANPLPVYRLVSFATHHTPGTSYYSISLVLNEGDDAQEAADSLRTRLLDYTLLRNRIPVSEFFADRGMEVVEAVGINDGPLPVALVVISLPDPSLTEDAGGMVQAYVFTWMDWIAARDTGFLALE